MYGCGFKAGKMYLMFNGNLFVLVWLVKFYEYECAQCVLCVVCTRGVPGLSGTVSKWQLSSSAERWPPARPPSPDTRTTTICTPRYTLFIPATERGGRHSCARVARAHAVRARVARAHVARAHAVRARVARAHRRGSRAGRRLRRSAARARRGCAARRRARSLAPPRRARARPILRSRSYPRPARPHLLPSHTIYLRSGSLFSLTIPYPYVTLFHSDIGCYTNMNIN